jgi:cytochrome b
MWRPAYKDRLDSNDRKKIRRIFYQMVGLYMSLVVIVIAGVVVRSVFTTLPEISFRQNVDLY